MQRRSTVWPAPWDGRLLSRLLQVTGGLLGGFQLILARPLLSDARADSGRAHIPKGGRFAAATAAIVVSLLAVSGAGGAGAQGPRVGGAVVIPPFVGGEPACLNAFIPACSGGTAVALMDFLPSVVLLGAFEAGPDLSLRPKLVSRVEFTRKPPFTFVYHIRPEARWSDGVPVTARDFVFTFRTLLSIDQLDDLERNLLEQIQSVRPLDAKTVRVVLRTRFAGWRRLFGAVLPAHALQGEHFGSVWKDRVDNPTTGKPIGSGPFLIAQWERGRRITLVRNPRYWGPHPAYLDRLVLRLDRVPEPAEAFPNGEIDLVSGFAPDREAVAYLRRIPGVRILSVLAPIWEHFDIRIGSGGHPALRNKLVRRALAYGVDRPAIVRELFGEVSPTQAPAESAIYLSNSPFHRPNWSDYRYRPAESRRLLERAGCDRGVDAIYVCGGERLSLRFFTRGDFRRRVRTLELVRENLKQAGVEVKPSFASGNIIATQILPSGSYDLLLYALVGAPPEEFGSDRFGCGGSVNFTGYCQRLVTGDLDQARRILDDRQRARVLNRADARMARDVPVIPLYWTPTVAAIRTTLRGFVLHPNHPFWGAENWWLER